VVSHAVTLVAVQAEAGQSVIGHDTLAAERCLAAIADASRDALIELDRMLHVLRDADGDRIDTEAGLERIRLERTHQGLGIAVETRNIETTSAENGDFTLRVSLPGASS
jgi:hypothetical protein